MRHRNKKAPGVATPEGLLRNNARQDNIAGPPQSKPVFLLDAAPPIPGRPRVIRRGNLVELRFPGSNTAICLHEDEWRELKRAARAAKGGVTPEFRAVCARIFEGMETVPADAGYALLALGNDKSGRRT